MTLLLASVGLSAQSPASWWFPLPDAREIAHSQFVHPVARQSNAVARKPLPARSLGSALFALVAIGLSFLLSDVRVRNNVPFPTSTARVPQQQSSSQEQVLQGTHLYDQLQWLPQHLQAMESSHTLKDVLAVPALAYQSNLPNQVKSLLEYEQIQLDMAQEALTALDLAIELSLPAFSYSDSSVAPRSKRKPKSTVAQSRLARVTVYWPDEGDFYTRNRKSSTGVRLRDGHCAVDPKVIPYGSVVSVPGVGPLVAVDTGSAVISRRAARATGRTLAQRKAIVIDIFCSSRSKARALIKRIQHFAVVSWQQPQRLSEL